MNLKLRLAISAGFCFGLDTPALVYDKGGGLTPLRGTTAARPSLFFSNPGQEFFVLVDLGDICNIGGNSGSITLHPKLGQVGTKMSLRRIREALEIRLDRFGRPSWGQVGSKIGAKEDNGAS